jgi:hypothetical protein
VNVYCLYGRAALLLFIVSTDVRTLSVVHMECVSARFGVPGRLKNPNRNVNEDPPDVLKKRAQRSGACA